MVPDTRAAPTQRSSAPLRANRFVGFAGVARGFQCVRGDERRCRWPVRAAWTASPACGCFTFSLATVLRTFPGSG